MTLAKRHHKSTPCLVLLNTAAVILSLVLLQYKAFPVGVLLLFNQSMKSQQSVCQEKLGRKKGPLCGVPGERAWPAHGWSGSNWSTACHGTHDVDRPAVECHCTREITVRLHLILHHRGSSGQVGRWGNGWSFLPPDWLYIYHLLQYKMASGRIWDDESFYLTQSQRFTVCCSDNRCLFSQALIFTQIIMYMYVYNTMFRPLLIFTPFFLNQGKNTTTRQ